MEIGALSALFLCLKAKYSTYSLSPIEIVLISNYVVQNMGNFGTKRKPVA
jgi:hypothetical protein